MNTEINLDEIKKLDTEIDARKRLFGKTMIAICLIGLLMAVGAFILLIVGVAKGNKVCEIVGIVLNFLDIVMIGFSLFKTMIKYNANLKQ